MSKTNAQSGAINHPTDDILTVNSSQSNNANCKPARKKVGVNNACGRGAKPTVCSTRKSNVPTVDKQQLDRTTPCLDTALNAQVGVDCNKPTGSQAANGVRCKKKPDDTTARSTIAPKLVSARNKGIPKADSQHSILVSATDCAVQADSVSILRSGADSGVQCSSRKGNKTSANKSKVCRPRTRAENTSTVGSEDRLTAGNDTRRRSSVTSTTTGGKKRAKPSVVNSDTSNVTEKSSSDVTEKSSSNQSVRPQTRTRGNDEIVNYKGSDEVEPIVDDACDEDGDTEIQSTEDGDESEDTKANSQETCSEEVISEEAISEEVISEEVISEEVISEEVISKENLEEETRTLSNTSDHSQITRLNTPRPPYIPSYYDQYVPSEENVADASEESTKSEEEPITASLIMVYMNGDEFSRPRRIPLVNRTFFTLDDVFREIEARIPDIFGGPRALYTLDGRRIESGFDLRTGGVYVVVGQEIGGFQKLDYGQKVTFLVQNVQLFRGRRHRKLGSFQRPITPAYIRQPLLEPISPSERSHSALEYNQTDNSARSNSTLLRPRVPDIRSQVSMRSIGVQAFPTDAAYTQTGGSMLDASKGATGSNVEVIAVWSTESHTGRRALTTQTRDIKRRTIAIQTCDVPAQTNSAAAELLLNRDYESHPSVHSDSLPAFQNEPDTPDTQLSKSATGVARTRSSRKFATETGRLSVVEETELNSWRATPATGSRPTSRATPATGSRPTSKTKQSLPNTNITAAPAQNQSRGPLRTTNE